MQNSRNGLVELNDDDLILVYGGQTPIPITLSAGTLIGVAGSGGTVTVTPGSVVAVAGPASNAFGFTVGPQGITFTYGI